MHGRNPGGALSRDLHGLLIFVFLHRSYVPKTVRISFAAFATGATQMAMQQAQLPRGNSQKDACASENGALQIEREAHKPPPNNITQRMPKAPACQILPSRKASGYLIIYTEQFSDDLLLLLLLLLPRPLLLPWPSGTSTRDTVRAPVEAARGFSADSEDMQQ